MKIRVYYEDTDCGGIVYHANYLRFCERARSEAFFSAGSGPLSECEFVVKSMEIKYLKTASLGDVLEVKSNLRELKGASTSVLQEIFNDRGELVFSANVLLACIDVARKKPARIPERFKEILRSLK